MTSLCLMFAEADHTVGICGRADSRWPDCVGIEPAVVNTVRRTLCFGWPSFSIHGGRKLGGVLQGCS